MSEDKHEKLHHNPEKGLFGSEKDSDKKDSKSRSKKSGEKQTSAPENRRAAFFKTPDTSKDEKKEPLIVLEKNSNTTENLDTKEDDEKSKEPTRTSQEKSVSTEHEEHITESEARESASQITEARQEEVANNLARVDEESVDEAEELAAAAFLTSVERHLGSGEDFTEKMLDRAERETIEDLHIEHVDEVTDEPGEVELNDELPEPEVENISLEEPPEIESENTDEEQPAQTPSSTNQGSAQSTSTSSVGNRGNGGGSFFPPIAPPPGQPPGSPSSPPNNVGFYNVQYNFRPVSPNVLPNQSTSTTDRNYRRRRAKHLLIGGIVGYVIGRRGGRKRTEKKLLPKIDTLEKEVTKLHDEIVQREEHVRKIARIHAEKEMLLSKELRESKGGTTEHKPTDKKTTVNDEKILILTNKERITQFVEKQQERQKAHDKQKTTERLHEEGSIKKMAETHLKGLGMFVERRKIDGTEEKRKRFELMNERELKEQARQITVDGVSVVTAFEAGRIDGATMLEVTKRYWRKDSGSYETVFRNNLKPDENELAYRREKLERAHESATKEQKLNSDKKFTSAQEYAKTLSEDFYNGDPSTLKTDEERIAYFQRYAHEEAQNSELGTLLKKAQNGSLLTRKSAWISLLFVVVLGLVIWFILG